MNKLSLFLLSMMVLVNFSFCFMPMAVSAQTLNKPKEIVPEISQKDINFIEEDRCEDTSHNYKTDSATSQETKTEQNKDTSNKNTVLPCCLNHNKITQIDNAPKLEINDLLFYDTSENNISNHAVLIQNSAYIQSLDLPPPKADLLFSVCKKE